MPVRLLVVSLVLAANLAWLSAAFPAGSEFQVNTYTTSHQFYPVVAADSAGNFVVVWESYGSAGSDTSGPSIQGQRYDSTGAAQGGEFQVNTFTSGVQGDPAVATDSAGNFVVVWQSLLSAGSDTSGYGIQGQRYDSTGAAQGGEFQVNTYTTANQFDPAVAADIAGSFVVVWGSAGSAGSDTSYFSIQGQRYTGFDFPLTDQLPGRTTIIRTGSLAKFAAKPVRGDTFALPAADPVVEGGALRIFDTAATAGDDTYTLPAGSMPPFGWTGFGSPPGSEGYRYRGAGTPSDPCKVVLVKERVIKAVCKGSGVTLAPPFTGDVGIILSLGTTDRYCARFGGEEVKNDATLTKRRNAAAPGACP